MRGIFRPAPPSSRACFAVLLTLSFAGNGLFLEFVRQVNGEWRSFRFDPYSYRYLAFVPGRNQVNLPASLQRHLSILAERECVSVDQFVATAVAEKMSAFLGVEYLEERARRGSREKYEAAPAKVPDVEPEDYDRL